MTYKEAMKVMRWALNRLEGHNYITDDYGTVDPSAKVNAFGMAIDALEKQVPKKPIEKFQVPYDSLECGLCHSCNEGVNSDMDFCSVCGQAIDWEGSE